MEFLRCNPHGAGRLALPDAGAGTADASASLAVSCVLERKRPRVLAQVIKRTLQTALVWTLYEELQPRLLDTYTSLREPRQHRARGPGGDR